MGEKRDRVRELRDQLSSRLGERAAFSSAVYRDAPIIMTASQMSSLLPEEIREMRRLLKDPALRRLSIAERFVEEAIVLQGCDDEFSGQADFECYFPTFEDMDDAQLRTYLTWRARARRGDVRPTSVSYVYVYLYELINHVGIEDDLQGWRALRAFADAYARIDAKILRLADQWADDYVVYYGLPADLLSPRFGLETSRAQEVLLHAALRSDEELAQALTRLGGYNVEASAFVSLHRRDFDRVLARVYRLRRRRGPTRSACWAKGRRSLAGPSPGRSSPMCSTATITPTWRGFATKSIVATDGGRACAMRTCRKRAGE